MTTRANPEFTRFKPVKCIFGYNQTEGEELPPAETPGWDLDTALGKLDIKRVPFRELNGNSRVHIGRKSPSIRWPQTRWGRRTTSLAMWCSAIPSRIRSAQYATHRGVMEFQAEATSYLTMHELEVMGEEQASESRAYIQGWLRQERPSDSPSTHLRSAVRPTSAQAAAGVRPLSRSSPCPAGARLGRAFAA